MPLCRKATDYENDAKIKLFIKMANTFCYHWNLLPISRMFSIQCIMLNHCGGKVELLVASARSISQEESSLVFFELSDRSFV